MVDLLNAELGKQPSQIWRVVHAGLDVLKQGLIRRIGDGESTLVWNHNWIPRDNLLRALHPISDDQPGFVSELIEGPSRTWNRAVVFRHMNRVDADSVLNIPLSTSSTCDQWAWQYEKSGVFLVRSAYRMLVDTKKIREDWLEN